MGKLTYIRCFELYDIPVRDAVSACMNLPYL